MKGEAYNSFDPSFETVEERAFREMARIQMDRQEKRDELKLRVENAKYGEWREGLTENQIKTILPEYSQKEGPTGVRWSWMRATSVPLAGCAAPLPPSV